MAGTKMMLAICLSLFAMVTAEVPSPVSVAVDSSDNDSSEPPVKKEGGEAEHAAAKMVSIARSKLERLKQTVATMDGDRQPLILKQIDVITDLLSEMETADDAAEVGKVAKTLAKEQASLREMLAAVHTAKVVVESPHTVALVVETGNDTTVSPVIQKPVKPMVQKNATTLRPTAKPAAKPAVNPPIRQANDNSKPVMAQPHLQHRPVPAKPPISEEQPKERKMSSLRDLLRTVVNRHRERLLERNQKPAEEEESPLQRLFGLKNTMEQKPNMEEAPHRPPWMHMPQILSHPPEIIMEITGPRPPFMQSDNDDDDREIHDEDDEEDEPVHHGFPLPHRPPNFPIHPTGMPFGLTMPPGLGPHGPEEPSHRMMPPLMGGLNLMHMGPQHENMRNPFMSLFSHPNPPTPPPPHHNALVESLTGPLSKILGGGVAFGGKLPEVSMEIEFEPRRALGMPSGMGPEQMLGLNPFTAGNPFASLIPSFPPPAHPTSPFHPHTPMGPPGFSGIHENATHVVTTFNLPNAKKETISVDVEKSTLIVKAELAHDHPFDMGRIMQSMMGGIPMEEDSDDESEKIEENVQLPFEAKPSAVHAAFKQGVLTVAFPRFSAGHVEVDME